MVSHKHKCIFVHIPKTGGTSISKKLGINTESRDHRTIRHIRPISIFKHAKYLLEKEKLREAGISRKNMVKDMTCIREKNETERVNEKKFKNYYKFTVVRNSWDRAYSWYRNVMRDKKHNIPTCEFSTFLKKYKNNWALRPQTYWIKDFDGRIPLDNIVKFESLNMEIKKVFEKIGIKDKKLPHYQKSRKKVDHRKAYNNETKKIVKNRYEEEINMFGFDF